VTIVTVIILASIMFFVGLRMLLWRPESAPKSAPISEDDRSEVDPRTYIFRIAGTMVMTFGLALGLMLTIFHLA